MSSKSSEGSSLRNVATPPLPPASAPNKTKKQSNIEDLVMVVVATVVCLQQIVGKLFRVSSAIGCIHPMLAYTAFCML